MLFKTKSDTYRRRSLARVCFHIGFCAFAVLSAFSQPAWADFQDGVEAFERGDYARALKEWQPLAQTGDLAALRNVGHLYLNGLGVEKDARTAAGYFRQAAERGLTSAQVQLADMYLRGEGVGKNAREAARWFNRAALQGEATAQYYMGLLSETGTGMTRSQSSAIGWYTLAARNGNADAANRLAQLVPQATPTPEPAVVAEPAPEPIPAPEPTVQPEPEPKAEPVIEAEAEAETEPKPEPVPTPPIDTVTQTADIPTTEDDGPSLLDRLATGVSGLWTDLTDLVTIQSDTLSSSTVSSTATSSTAAPSATSLAVESSAVETINPDLTQAPEPVDAEQPALAAVNEGVTEPVSALATPTPQVQPPPSAPPLSLGDAASALTGQQQGLSGALSTGPGLQVGQAQIYLPPSADTLVAPYLAQSPEVMTQIWQYSLPTQP